ncbi:hypothetical protein BAUCODRAFT_68253 [Baudoinia panamericana UAMH 10762]|uniref:Bacteriophage T5 Orf172 DNA-binding domain-containing protein n=1 Tax=Baudoinia panamericana (strain UAMH 10762) TaxID=717646 RepID=M2MJP2_BAUPA|nr:uncharacterized protein BAUCODRAFT_68253 [Baudoinia panamericana UAMH 10762]EMC96916.1 hypothetical protein BAUCODRAFT_68253 [Baudoinia panamericana UAMH 10762]
MPTVPHTPEALLGRNDSKNPSTTCKGITSSGRPCRRALASPKSSPLSGRRKSEALTGVVAIVQEDGLVREADFYCWQHKDQAHVRSEKEERRSDGGRVGKKRSVELYSLKERSSIDTMVQSLGLNDLSATESKAHRTNNPKPPRRTEMRDFASSEKLHAVGSDNLQPALPRRKTKKPGFWASFCCVASGNDDYVEIVRHRKRVQQNPQLLSSIPSHLSPATTSALLAELIKPISPHDEEGYIYIFWLTPQSKATPSEDTARSLLTPPRQRPGHERRISDVVTEFSFSGSEPETSGKKTIMLKIGRANNVTRRMNQWQRQCGYALNLVRWYPYVSSSPQASPVGDRRESLYPDLSQLGKSCDVLRKVPYVKRVERLIHLELRTQQVKRRCKACGKEHREWFEVEASQKGVRAVNECVRRWVSWAERQAKQ